MFTVLPTRVFSDWLARLKDARAASRIAARIVRVEAGNMGDVKAVGGRVSELRVDHGPGYRVYLTVKDRTVVILLCGDDKSTQARDIAAAQAMADELHQTRLGKEAT